MITSGCAADVGSEDEKRLRVAVSTEPATFDPIISTNVPASEPIRNVFETLVTIDSKNRVKPMLASSYARSADRRQVTFTLRKGVPFHDGRTMRAADVVASMNRWLKFSSAGTFHFPSAKFVKLDEYTVALKTKSPSSTDMLDLAYGSSNLPAIMPADIANRAGAEPVTRYIGTGPFKLRAWEKGQQIVFDRFDQYSARSEPPDGMAGDRSTRLDGLNYVFVPDASTSTLGVESGEYHVAKDLPYDNMDWLQSRGLDVGITPRTNLPNLYFNKKQGPFAKREARRAVAVGVDRKAIMAAAFTDKRFYGTTTDFMASSLDNLWDSDVGRKEYAEPDVPAAKRLLKRSGYRGQTVTILTSRDSRPTYYASVVLQSQLKKLGVNSRLSTYDYATMTQRRDDPTAWNLIVVMNFTKLEPTQMTFFRGDFPGWTKDARLDKVMARFRSAPSVSAAQPIYGDLQRWFVDYVPVVKLGEASDVYASSPDVTGVRALDSTLVLWSADIDD